MTFKNMLPMMVFLVAISFAWAGNCRAAGLFTFNDMEKPNPEFTRSNGEISAKLIPRAKSTSVLIRFAVPSGGRLAEVRGVDFQTVDRPEVDVKNFKSAAFEIWIEEVTPGEAAEVAVRSDFFTIATAFYVFNPRQAKPWIVPDVLNSDMGERVRELRLRVADGGPLDADGARDGKITVIGGPRDSFWGYALGTLFIRFFGIFIVLSFLMVGMLLSGFAFKWHERRRLRSVRDDFRGEVDGASADAGVGVSGSSENEISEEEIAAVGAALHLHFNRQQGLADAEETDLQPAAWAASGRQRIMQDRLMVFNRLHRQDN